MAVDKTKACRQDRARINVDEDCELRNWAKKFGVLPDEVRQAVAAVGDRAEAVERRLSGPRPAKRGG